MNLKKYFDKFWESVRGSPARAKANTAVKFLHISKKFRQLTDKERIVTDKNGNPTGMLLPEFWAEKGVTYDVGKNKAKAKRKVASVISRMLAIQENRLRAAELGISVPHTPKRKFA